MSVLEEVTQKRDQCVKWQIEGSQAEYQPAIDFYNRIIDEITSLQKQNVTEILASEPTNVEKLRNKLNEFGGTIHSVFPGTGPTTPEELAGQLLATITSIENGDFEIVTDKED